MRKLIAAINMTVDGYCDHTAVNPDEEIHDYYTQLVSQAGLLLYGRTTYHLMEYWREVIKNPTGEKSMDAFAAAIDKTPKLVFSHSLKSTDWHSARIAELPLEQEVKRLKDQPGGDIYIGSPSLIVQLTNLKLVDAYELCVHPVLSGGGLPLFKSIQEKHALRLEGTRTFRSGAIVLSYSQA